MSLLLQVVTASHEISALWQWAAITLLGILLARAASQRAEDKKVIEDACKKREALEEKVASQARQLDRLDVLVGTNGNGIIQRLDTMNHKLDKVLNEQAELRGAAGNHHREG